MSQGLELENVGSKCEFQLLEIRKKWTMIDPISMTSNEVEEP